MSEGTPGPNPHIDALLSKSSTIELIAENAVIIAAERLHATNSMLADFGERQKTIWREFARQSVKEYLANTTAINIPHLQRWLVEGLKLAFRSLGNERKLEWDDLKVQQILRDFESSLARELKDL